jgi:biopolymer transport protein ExbB
MNAGSGILNVWAQGDVVTRSVLVLLLCMSLASWIVMILKTLNLVMYARQSRNIDVFWHAKDFAQGISLLAVDSESPYLALALEGEKAAKHVGPAENGVQHALHEGFDFSDWLTRSLQNGIDDATAGLQSGLAILASAGSTAPFIGLFGTVWGIYHALMAIGLAGQASLDKVAGPIGESLIMTALGLAVAIPAVLGYNAIVRGNKKVLSRLNRFAHDLHAYFLTGARVGNIKQQGKEQ